LDWVGAVLNAVSLAVGVATGSLISWLLLRRETKGVWKKVEASELYVRLNTVLREANELLASEEARNFFKNLTLLLQQLTVKPEKAELIKLPKRVKDEG